MIANQSKWLPIFKRGILQRMARCAYKHPKTDYIYKFLNRSLSVAHIVQGGVCVSWSYTSPTYALLLLFFDIGVIVIGWQYWRWGLCLMLLTPPQPPNRHCSRPPPWHPHSLALNRYEQPIHRGRVFSICSKANISWQTTTIEVTKQASKNFPTSSVSKIEIFAAKELCGSRAISAQISLSEKPY